MSLSEDIRRKLIDSFKTEQGEHVQKIIVGLLALEKKPQATERQAHLDEVFREAHSLKGAARAVGMTTIESLGHAMEELLLAAKEGRIDFSAELFDLLYQGLDAVSLVITRLEVGDTVTPASVLALLVRLDQAVQTQVGGDGEARGSLWMAEIGESNLLENTPPVDWLTQPSVSHASDETIRIAVSKLDAIMAQFSELLAAKIRAEQRLLEVRELHALGTEWHKEWLTLRGGYNRLIRQGTSENGQTKDMLALLDFTGQNQDRLRQFNARSGAFYRQFSNDTMRLSLIIDELQEEIKRARMLPLSTITTTFGRMIRDLSRGQDKEIGLTVFGGETELDKRILEQIKDPLIHLLRNAVDHGLEPKAERQAAGKFGEGRIHLTAAQQGNNIVIVVADDGRGLDLAAIRSTAVRRGWFSEAEAERLSESEVAALIFNSGLSTSKIITDLSGRGVGLDVVRQNVEALHGILSVDFEPGQSTTFTMTLPLTLASSGGLLIRVGQQVFALPLTNVERMVEVEQTDVARVDGKAAITYQNRPVSLAWLEDLLGLPSSRRDTARLTVVIIGTIEKRLGLVVDSLEGEQEIVMKNLGKQLLKVGGVAGATVLGSGQVVLVLHAADLVKLAGRLQPDAAGPVETISGGPQRKTILVVDDSITTRTLEKNILEAAGYTVKIATNGEEALGMLVTGDLPDLIISDVNMPRLDGLGLASRVRQDDRYRAIPFILVTSLDSAADKARGIEVGADAYIVKSRFDQGNLLDTIEQLI